MTNPPKSPERIERSIIRSIGRVRFVQLQEFVEEGVSIDFLVQEFGLSQPQIQYIMNRPQVTTTQIRSIQTR